MTTSREQRISGARTVSADLERAAQSIADARQVLPLPRLRMAARAFRRHEPHLARVSLTGTLSAVPTLPVRRSSRRGGPIHIAALSAVLLEANRVLAFADGSDGYTVSWRPNPSAGARHPIDLLVDVIDVRGMNRGSWWFDPVRAELVAGDVDLSAARARVRDAVDTADSPAAIVYLIADFTRTLSRYEHGTSLVWRDAGALAVVLQNAACAAEIGACIAGTAAVVSSDIRSADVGAVVLGG